MKTKKNHKKMNLNKETVVNLEVNKMGKAKGGALATKTFDVSCSQGTECTGVACGQTECVTCRPSIDVCQSLDIC